MQVAVMLLTSNSLIEQFSQAQFQPFVRLQRVELRPGELLTVPKPSLVTSVLSVTSNEQR